MNESQLRLIAGITGILLTIVVVLYSVSGL